jgi:hypothetical protein
VPAAFPDETLPNQIRPPAQRRSLRWILAILQGIHPTRVTMQDHWHDLIGGFDKVKYDRNDIMKAPPLLASRGMLGGEKPTTPGFERRGGEMQYIAFDSHQPDALARVEDAAV